MGWLDDEYNRLVVKEKEKVNFETSRDLKDSPASWLEEEYDSRVRDLNGSAPIQEKPDDLWSGIKNIAGQVGSAVSDVWDFLSQDKEQEVWGLSPTEKIFHAVYEGSVSQDLPLKYGFSKDEDDYHAYPVIGQSGDKYVYRSFIDGNTYLIDKDKITFEIDQNRANKISESYKKAQEKEQARLKKMKTAFEGQTMLQKAGDIFGASYRGTMVGDKPPEFEMTSGSKVVDEIASLAGTLSALYTPYSGAGAAGTVLGGAGQKAAMKAAGKLPQKLPTILKNVSIGAAKSGTYMGGLGAYRSFAQGDTPEEIIKNTLKGTAVGVGAGGITGIVPADLTEKIGGLINKTIKNISDSSLSTLEKTALSVLTKGGGEAGKALARGISSGVTFGGFSVLDSIEKGESFEDTVKNFAIAYTTGTIISNVMYAGSAAKTKFRGAFKKAETVGGVKEHLKTASELKKEGYTLYNKKRGVWVKRDASGKLVDQQYEGVRVKDKLVSKLSLYRAERELKRPLSNKEKSAMADVEVSVIKGKIPNIEGLQAVKGQPAVNKQGIIPYAEKEAKNLRSHRGFVEGVDMALDEFIDRAVEGVGKTTEKLYMGKASKELSDRIKKATGLNVEGYNFVITNQNIKKIFKSHGTEKTERPRGQIPVTKKLLSDIKKVFAEPDVVELSDIKTTEGKPILLLKKSINGYAVTVENVSDGKHLLTTQTFYVINKKKPAEGVSGKKPFTITSETDSGTASDVSIPQKKESINIKEVSSIIKNPESTKGQIESAISQVEEYKSQLKTKLRKLEKMEQTEEVKKQLEDTSKQLLKIDLQLFAAKKKAGKPVNYKTKQRIYDLQQKFRDKVEGVKYVDWWKRELVKKDAKKQLAKQKEKLKKQAAQREEKKIAELKQKHQESKERTAQRTEEKIEKIKEEQRESKKRAAEKKQVRDERNKMMKNLKSLNLKHMRPEYKLQVEEILKDIDYTVTKRTQKTLNRLSKLKKYIEENPENNMPESVLKKLELLSKRTVGDLSPAEFKAIHDSVMHLSKLEQLKNKMIFGKVYKEAAQIVNEAVDNIKKKTKKVDVDPDYIDTTVREKEAGYLKKVFTVESYNPELITELLDRTPHGIIKKVLYEGIDQGTSKMLRYQHQAEDMFRESLKGIDISKWSEAFNKKRKNVDYQEIKLASGKIMRITKAERISIYLYTKNKRNLKHILRGGFSFEGSKDITYRITSDDLDVIRNSLTKDELKVADTIYEFFNSFQKKHLNEVSVELNGWEIATEKDYFPIRTNEIDRKRDDLRPKNTFTQNTLEGMGMLKERINAGNAIILEDAFKAVYSSMKKTSAYYGLAKPLRNAKMLLHNKGFRTNLSLRYGTEYWESLKNYIDELEGSYIKTDSLDRLTTELINRLDVAILGANPWVMLKQPVSYLIASTEMDIKYLLKAVTSRVDKKEIRKYSPQLRDRLDGNISREMGEIGAVGAVRKFFTGKHAGSQKFMSGIQKFDFATVGRIWNAAKLEIKDKHPGLQGDAYMKKVAERAEEVIRLTQPTFALKDRSQIGRTKATHTRLFTKYSSQRNKNYNAIRRAILRYNTNKKTSADKAKLFKNLFTITVLSSLMIHGVDRLRDLVYGRDNKSKGILSLAVKIFGNILSSAYVVGDVFNAIASNIERGPYRGFDINNPVSSFAKETWDAIALVHQAIENISTQERYKTGPKRGEKKFKYSAVKAIDKSLAVVLKFKGIPYAVMRKNLEAIIKLFLPEN